MFSSTLTRRSLKTLAVVLLLPGVFALQVPASHALSISGSLEIGTPLWASELNLLHYGLDNISLSGTAITIRSNNDSWRSDNSWWPGVVLDKIFFAPASATTGGIFTADVEITKDGNTFPAVINPDLGSFLPPGSFNTSGQFTGASQGPDSFSFVGLPVYAIVPYAGGAVVELPSALSPWSYDAELYAADGTPQFSLAQLGTLSLVATSGSYHALGSFDPVAAVPEPENYAMLLAGLGLIALVAHRRRRLGIGAAA